MKTPTACSSLADVRAEIDRLDGQIIALLRQRADYVHVAAAFKANEAAVAAPERQKAVLVARREWAEREGLDPDFIERLYREILAYFISREMESWRK
jgi:isochorismate pyruvate lyase